MSEYSRLFADALKDSVAGLRKDEETRVSRYVQPKLLRKGRHLCGAVVDSLPPFKKKPQRSWKGRRPGSFGWFSLGFLIGSVQTESSLLCFRSGEAIANRKPARLESDPTTNFWTVYKKVADEHEKDMVSKYAGNLDACLLFVSVFASLVCFVCLNQVLFPH